MTTSARPECHGKHSTSEYCADCREYDAVIRALEAVPEFARAEPPGTAVSLAEEGRLVGYLRLAPGMSEADLARVDLLFASILSDYRKSETGRGGGRGLYLLRVP